jgi:hypothetical protein
MSISKLLSRVVWDLVDEKLTCGNSPTTKTHGWMAQEVMKVLGGPFGA